jgi:hypothetical protein
MIGGVAVKRKIRGLWRYSVLLAGGHTDAEKERRNRLFECIGMDEGVGSPEGYIAKTRRDGTRIIPSGEQQHERYSLYRIGCTQEKRARPERATGGSGGKTAAARLIG